MKGSDWRRIESGISIGLNTWIFHTFRPQILSFEDVSSDRLAVQKKAMQVGLQKVSELESPPLLLKFRSKSNLPPALRLRIPDSLLPSARIYGRYPIPPFKSDKSLRTMINRSLRAEEFGKIAYPLLIDNGASLVRMITLAMRLRPRRIILVGVDVFNSTYFWETDSSFLEELGIPPFAVTSVHSIHGTQLPRSGSIPILQFLDLFVSSISSSRGISFRSIGANTRMNSIAPALE